jgi:molecular chaperone DnaK (HSP70)
MLNGQAGAFRHCLWNAIMAKKIGVGNTKVIRDLVEKNSKGTKEQKDMNLFNNAHGMTIGVNSFFYFGQRDACQKAAKNGTLKVLE